MGHEEVLPPCGLLVNNAMKSSAQVHSVAQTCTTVTACTEAHQASLSITNSQSLLRFMSIESVMPIQPSQPLLSPSPPACNLSQHQGLFQCISFSHQVAKVWEIQLQHEASKKYSGLIFFKIDWLDLL